MSESRASWLFWAISYPTWIVRRRRARMMAGFSHTEAGSSLDMLAAVEESTLPYLRRIYFRHAMDERRHARIFARRSRELAPAGSRVDAVLNDASYIPSHGIRGERSLYSELGETEFLAFVWYHEDRAARQFEVYQLILEERDPDSSAMFEDILKDEGFHIAYSRKELDKRAAAGGEREVRRAIRRVRSRRWLQYWLRLSRRFGDMIAQLQLAILYYGVFAPFALVAKRSESLPGGLLPPERGLPDPRLEAASQR